MVETAGIILFFIAAFTLVGVPLALVVRERTAGWFAVAADALLLGIAVVTCTIVVWQWLGVAAAALMVLAWLGLLAWCVVSYRAVFPRWVTPRPALVVTWLGVLGLAFALRLHDVNFLPWVGDMGAYVSWANEFVRIGVLNATWPPLFPALLAVSSAIFGSANTTAIVGVTGFAMIFSVVRLLQRFGVGRGIQLLAAVTVALHPHAVWYSNFPASESLNAPLFLLWIALIHFGLSSSGRSAVAAFAGQVLLVVALSLLRGSGTLLVIPVVLLVVLSFVVPAWRSARTGALLALSSTALGVAIGYSYGITEIRPYFVAMQIRGILPERISDLLEGLGLFDPSPGVFLLLLVPATLAALAALAVAKRPALPRRLASVDIRRGAWLVPFVGVAIGGVLLVGVVAGIVVGAEAAMIALRMGVWLLLGTAAVLIFGLRSITRSSDQLAVVLAGLSITMFVGLHTIRLGGDRQHDFYLYWDRYLVSETLLALIVLAALGAHLLAERSTRNVRALGASAIVALAVIPSIAPLSLQARETYMAGAYEFTDELRQVAESEGPGLPVLWAATAAQPTAGWFFPNTWMAFGLPFEKSFGLDVLNVDQREYNFAPDDVLSDEDIRNYLACRPDAPGIIVFEVAVTDPSGQRVATPLEQRSTDPALTLELLAERTSAISLLAQRPGTDWTTARIPVSAWLVTLAPGGGEGTCPIEPRE